MHFDRLFLKYGLHSLRSGGATTIDRMYFPAVSENTIQHDRADSIGRVLLR
jgi:hypothetical protein